MHCQPTVQHISCEEIPSEYFVILLMIFNNILTVLFRYDILLVIDSHPPGTLTELYCSIAGAISRNVACYYYFCLPLELFVLFRPLFSFLAIFSFKTSFSYALICFVNMCIIKAHYWKL